MVKLKNKNKGKKKKTNSVAVDLTKPSVAESTLNHTDSDTHTLTPTHTPAHTPTHSPVLPITADTAKVPSGASHEVSQEDLDRRHLRPVDPLRPCESLNAGQTSSVCRNRSNRDTPTMMESRDERTPQHYRDLSDDSRGPGGQPRQSDLSLH